MALSSNKTDDNENESGGSSPLETAVNVEAAEKLFSSLSHQLSHKPDQNGEAATDDDVRFDLEGYLRNEMQQKRNAGLHDKHVDVSWDITVQGKADVRRYQPTFLDACLDVFGLVSIVRQAIGSVSKEKQAQTFNILTDFKGIAKSGTMTLVLGRPGSGCTTFLKVLANYRAGFTDISGDVYYNGIPSAEFGEKYDGETVYNQEDDVFLPTLTVKQTLGFALDMKTPRARAAGLSRSEFKEKVIDMSLKMFNIEHTKDTMIGNAFIRGISGGERKRVSIAEMLTASAAVTCWDNTTRGLDASTALDYAKSLRILADIYGMTMFVSLYQASENIYRQFDNVMVIDKGHQVYYGPASEARAYFEGLGFAPKPRQTTADYLTGCTDEHERGFVEGMDASSIPATPEGLAAAFRKSHHWHNLERLLVDDQRSEKGDSIKNFEHGVAEAKAKHTHHKSVFSAPFHRQVWGNVKQLTLLRWSSKLPLYAFIWTWMATAFIQTSLIYRFSDSSNDAFTRAGTLFLMCMLIVFQSIGEMPPALTNRDVYNKHRIFTLYRPSALWFAQLVVDILFLGTQIFFFLIVEYFLSGLATSAGGFFTDFLVLTILMLSIVLCFRVGVIVNPDFDSALRATSFLTPFMIQCSGFITKRQNMLGWIRWAYWLNPVQYAFTALSGTEFEKVNFTCAESSLVPNGPNYSDIRYQTCTLAGSEPGTISVPGTAYLNALFGVEKTHIWRGVGVLFAFAFFFLAGTLVASELITFGLGGRTTKFYIKEDKRRRELNGSLREKKANQSAKGSDEQAQLEIKSKSTLTWENLTYDVPTATGPKRLLNEIDGYVQPGHLTALMGASGAGKTTLLDVLAQRKSVGVIGGDVLVDGQVPGIRFQRSTAYCEQLDVHEPTATVREALRFSAYLRQPPEVSEADKDAYVEEVIALLEMEDIVDTVIGSTSTGLVVEERKRVTIGVELAAKPEMLLFLDEPTSGLDSQSAFNIVRFLKKLAAAGQAILCTIHQPNSALFENFDRLLLLTKGGNTVYFGEIGQDASVLRGYFEKNGVHCPVDVNVAEWMLDAIGAGSGPPIGHKNFVKIWRESPEHTKVKEDIQLLSQPQTNTDNQNIHEVEYATSFLFQIIEVCKRTSLAYYRSPSYGYTRVVNHINVGLWTGLFFINIGSSRSDLQYRVFAIFATTVLPVLVIFQVQPRMDVSRSIFYREQSSKMYSPYAFVIGLVAAEIPYSVLSALIFWICLYLPTGMDRSAARGGFQFLVILLTEFFAVTLAMAIQALTPNFFVASLLNPFILVLFTIMSGVMIPKPNMQPFWKSWMYQLDPFIRIISPMSATALHNVSVTCTPEELNSFAIPTGTTCGKYTADFMTQAPGYIVNATATGFCDYCALSKGDDFLEELGISYSNRGRDVGILGMFCVTNLIIVFLAMRYFNFSKK